LQYSNDPVVLADNVLFAKETIRAVSRHHGYKALFCPKYDMGKAGNGMHVHLSIRNATTGQPMFCNGSALTPKGSSFVEGVLRHFPGLMGLTLPTVNSFRRVGVGSWTGSQVAWALEDKESGLRVCSNLTTKEWDHVEYKLCDSTCNLYLALAGLVSAGVEGVAKEWALRPAMGSPGAMEPQALPESVEKAFDALEGDALIMTMMGPRLSKGYLALRRHEADRASSMTLEDEVREALARS
jgi:glutamine synthetase